MESTISKSQVTFYRTWWLLLFFAVCTSGSWIIWMSERWCERNVYYYWLVIECHQNIKPLLLSYLDGGLLLSGILWCIVQVHHFTIGSYKKTEIDLLKSRNVDPIELMLAGIWNCSMWFPLRIAVEASARIFRMNERLVFTRYSQTYNSIHQSADLETQHFIIGKSVE